MAETQKVVPLKPVAKKKPAVKKAAAKKPAAKKVAAKTTKKTAAKKTTVKKAVAKKQAVKKPAKKTVAKNLQTKKPATKKATTKKAEVKKAAFKKQAKASTKPKTPVKLKAKAKPVIKSTNTIKKETIMTQGQAQFDQFAKEAANLNREGIDAFVKAGTIFTRGFEDIMKETLALAQNSAEKQMQLAKDAMTSKTINEFSDAQNKLAQTSFDDFMSGTTKITELGVKVFSEAIEPINEQVQKSVQKATDAVAAE